MAALVDRCDRPSEEIEGVASVPRRAEANVGTPVVRYGGELFRCSAEHDCSDRKLGGIMDEDAT
jgi:hypothetical protein